MKPQNWGAVSILMVALAVGLGMVLSGTLGVVLDPVLSQLETAVQNAMGGSRSA